MATARDPGLTRLEAVLFVAGGSLSSRKLAQFAGLADGTQARTLVARLNELYDGEGSAFRVEEVAGGFQLMTRPAFGPWLRRLHTMPVQVRLSTPAMETLAVVAYRQPVLRAELEAIRGVQCGEMLRQLNERDLVRIIGRSPELGRPFLYGTTKRFLQVFGLRSVDELPRAEYLRGGSSSKHASQPQPSQSTNSDGTTSEGSTESQEESAVNVAILTPAAERTLEEQLDASPVSLEDGPATKPLADISPEDDNDDAYEDDDEFEDDEDEEDEEFEEDEWEEVEDDEDLDDDDEDWDDDDEDWGDDDEEEEEPV